MVTGILLKISLGIAFGSFVPIPEDLLLSKRMTEFNDAIKEDLVLVEADNVLVQKSFDIPQLLDSRIQEKRKDSIGLSIIKECHSKSNSKIHGNDKLISYQNKSYLQ